MLASRLSGLLPPLNNHEALESAAIYSLISSASLQKQWRRRPFRSPHHSASLTAMVGGGSIPGPGEISLAHNGILFLDELPEFERRVLDALREPIESGEIHISRTRAKISYPAQFQLVAAMNPARRVIIRATITAVRQSRRCAIWESFPARSSTVSIYLSKSPSAAGPAQADGHNG
jgi:magnesium chelatase family protein